MGEHDKKIRDVLVPHLRATWPAETMLVQEWGITTAVVDVALIGRDQIEGFEIKSAADSVTRLKYQVPAYNAFDVCTLVTEHPHLRFALKHLPTWWEIALFENGAIRRARRGRRNPEPQLANLLVASELRPLLRERGWYREALEAERDYIAEYTWPPWSIEARARWPSKRTMMKVLNARLAQMRARRRRPLEPTLHEIICTTIRERPDWRLPDGRGALSARNRIRDEAWQDGKGVWLSDEEVRVRLRDELARRQ